MLVFPIITGMPTKKSPTSVPTAEISKKRKRVTGRPLIKMEDAVLLDKIAKMQNHDATAAGELSENCG